MKHTFRLFAAAAFAVAAFLPAAGALADETIEIEHVWARATAPTAANGAAFMAIENEGAADRIVSASADVSKDVELHTHIMDGDVMRMRQVEAIEVPADGKVELKPGGLHVMFIGLNAPLKEGTTFPLTLTFAEAGAMTVDVHVGKPGAMGAMHGDHSEHTGEHHGDMKKKHQ